MGEILSIKEKLALIDKLSEKLDKERKTTNTLVRLNKKTVVPVPAISLGLPTFDYEVAQFGGIPKGRVIEIFGAESAGKTTTALHIIAETQKQGGLAVFIDAEHALDPLYAQALGVDLSKLVINQPDSGEQALKTVDEIVDNNAADLIVVDSAAALVPEAELAGEIGDSHVGLQARMMSQALRILTGKLAKTGIALIFLNQIREKIGVMYGNPETTSGGRALKFYSSLRLKIRRGEAIKDGTKIIGHKVIVKAEKNKGGIPFRETELELLYPGDERVAGFDKMSDTVMFAVRLGILETKGSWYWFNGERLANGLDNLKIYLLSNDKTMDKVKEKIREQIDSMKESIDEKI